MKKLLLFDGNALMHRAYHALPVLTSPQGWMVNSVYGFFSILLSVLARHQPDYLAVAFDVKGPTFRDKLYRPYKAKRVKPPQSFYDQIPIIKKLLNLMEIPVLEKRGFEADDVIGSVSLQISLKHIQLETLIVTSDKDALQLVGKKIKVLSFSKGVSREELWGVKQVWEKHGFLPFKMIDYKALAGDQSDNIPGVAGIGSKTATRLLKDWGSLERIYQNLDKIEPSWRQKLIQGKSKALLSQKLAAIDRSLEIAFDLKQARVHDFDKDRIAREFLRLGFKSLVKRLPESKRKQARQGQLL